MAVAGISKLSGGIAFVLFKSDAEALTEVMDLMEKSLGSPT